MVCVPKGRGSMDMSVPPVCPPPDRMLWWGPSAFSWAVTKSEPPGPPHRRGFVCQAFLSLPTMEKAASASALSALSAAAVLRADKARPFTAARADGAIHCLDNSTTKPMWPFRLHQLDWAPRPLWLFRALRRENSHRPQGRLKPCTNSSSGLGQHRVSWLPGAGCPAQPQPGTCCPDQDPGSWKVLLTDSCWSMLPHSGLIFYTWKLCG